MLPEADALPFLDEAPEMLDFKQKNTACLAVFGVSLAGEEGFEPSNAGIRIRCLNQLGDSPTSGKYDYI